MSSGILDELKQELKFVVIAVAKYWKAITAAATIGAGFLYLLILFVYSRAVGRIDLFNDPVSLEVALLPWLLGTLFVFFSYMAVLFSSTGVYVALVRLFLKSRERAKKMSLLLSFPVLVGVTIFVVLALKFDWLSHLITLVAVAASVALTIVGHYRYNSYFRESVRVSARSDAASTGAEKAMIVFFLFLLWYLVMSVVVTLVLVLILLSQGYAATDPEEDVNVFIALSLIALPSLLVPVIVFYASCERLALRLLQSSGIAIALSVAIIGVFPGVASTVIYQAAFLTGARESKVYSYKLMDEEPQNYEAVEWGFVKVENGKPVVRAFPLFSVGNTLLLCPEPLLKVKLYDLPSQSDLCLLTNKSAVKRLVRQGEIRPEHTPVFGMHLESA